ncbi:M48 family metallopeptidase [Pinibacter aurantiacus]|uniref:M48 family metallopeptidase n=1 Tax=Pinibacter aurantiacus TaxID=2851599 RepID=A0A9E2S7U3_9BACT|nr:M48 family metallopeptidase [Pinibacter aurantiacus]MBV4356109.1 M48 family metallopeptidase [Pinibacter aurantiacus]
MKRIISTFLLPLSVAAMMSSCTRNSFTGRSQLSLVPESQVQAMALTEYTQFLDSAKVVSTADKNAQMVARVGQRIANAVTQYAAANNMSDQLQGYKWEYHLVQSNEVNAWCMPGGKIVVYTGLLPITQNENALAVVMGHEVMHAVARHGSERMSQGLVQQYGGEALSVMLASKPAATQQLFMTAYGVGSQVGVMLPFSRKDELEADKFGLYFCAMAGYDPREAIPLWQRMEKASEGSSRPPEMLSTHPVESTRIAQLQQIMPEALKYYKPAANASK